MIMSSSAGLKVHLSSRLLHNAKQISSRERFISSIISSVFMENEKQRDMEAMQKWIIKRALEPVKAMVLSKELDAGTAAALVAKSVNQYSDENHEPEFKRFKDNSSLVFKDEVFFEAEYQDHTMPISYNYLPSSKVDVHFLYQLHQHLKGGLYHSPKTLLTSLENLCKGKRLLELGCGPGFGLAIFQRLGARATGIELREDYRGKVAGVDIRYGNACSLEELCKDEKFDIIYSKDFFAQACMEEENAKKVVIAMYQSTAEQGVGIHLLTYEKMHPIFAEFMMWLSGVKAGYTTKEAERKLELFTEDEKEEPLWTNWCTLNPQHVIRQGFAIEEYSITNGNLVIVTRR